MEIKYQIFEEENLLVQKFSGVFSIETYMKYTRSIMGNPASKSINQVLIDFREVNFKDLPEDFNSGLDRMTEMRKNINKEDKKRRDVSVVFWVDTPIPTVVAHIFKQNFSNYNYCSNEDHVHEIIKASEQFNNLDKVIRNLKSTF